MHVVGDGIWFVYRLTIDVQTGEAPIAYPATVTGVAHNYDQDIPHPDGGLYPRIWNPKMKQGYYLSIKLDHEEMAARGIQPPKCNEEKEKNGKSLEFEIVNDVIRFEQVTGDRIVF